MSLLTVAYLLRALPSTPATSPEIHGTFKPGRQVSKFKMHRTIRKRGNFRTSMSSALWAQRQASPRGLLPDSYVLVCSWCVSLPFHQCLPRNGASSMVLSCVLEPCANDNRQLRPVQTSLTSSMDAALMGGQLLEGSRRGSPVIVQLRCCVKKRCTRRSLVSFSSTPSIH